MPHVLNFDTLTYDTVTLEKRGKKWTLRDDVPTKVLMRAFSMLAIQEQLQRAIQQAQQAHPEDTQAALAAIEARFDDLERETASHVGAIFRHTDKSVTDDELLETFTFEDLLQIITLFFTIRSQASNPRPGASSASSRAATAASPTQVTALPQNANRSQRRSATTGKRS